MTTTAMEIDVTSDVMQGLEGVCASNGLDALGARLFELRTWLAKDLEEMEAILDDVGLGETTLAHRAARHLLDQGGKRLRPICVALAARAGRGFTSAARTYATAVEMVHSATLLHDDVVDLGDLRRGKEAARVVYGNAASIFGGDWLLVDALCRIEREHDREVSLRMLEVIKEMVIAEARQLAARGVVRRDVEEYFAIVRGKTAALFRWAMFAGARAGEVDASACAALELYGEKLGVAFQIVDDVLDFTGGAETGKTLLADLREGKMTYPLLLAMERDPRVVATIEAIARANDHAIDASAERRILSTIREHRVVEDSIDLATRLAREAITALEVVPQGRARSALEAVATSTAKRRR